MTYNWNKYWWKWTLACTAGELLGIGLAAGLVATYLNVSGEPQGVGESLQFSGIMLLAGVIEGLLIGIFQWKILSRLFPQIPAISWISMTALAALVGWLLGALSSVTLSAPAESLESGDPSVWMNLFIGIGSGILLGALFGLFQSQVLKNHLERVESWILANALGWGAGLVWIFIAASIPHAQTPLVLTILIGVAGGIVAGFCVGGITGWFLMRLVYLQPQSEQEDEDVT